MYVQRSGFRPPHEALATHCRRRFRLTQARNPDPSLPLPDESLWIVHYYQTEPQNHFPANRIHVSEQVRQTISERKFLQQHGQLVRKEFMLRDSASWPTIHIPGNTNPPFMQQAVGYPGDVISHMNKSQQQVYLQQQQQQQQQRQQQQQQHQQLQQHPAATSQHGIGPSPAKRARHVAPGYAHQSTTAVPAPVIAQDLVREEEEATAGGDYMDFITPRDISLHRYIQHHEWLEEILNSQFDTRQIIPGELGLGRKGELESLTKDFFDAPTGPTPKEKFETPSGESPMPDSATPRVGRLGAGKAKDFTRRATEKVAEINAEMEKLKRQHAKRMLRLNKTQAFRDAQEDLRLSTLDMVNGHTSDTEHERQKSVDDLVRRVEVEVGKYVKPVMDVECVQKGGLEEKVLPKDITDQDYDMLDTFANLDGTETHQLSDSAPQIPNLHTGRTNSAVTAMQSTHSHSPDVKMDEAYKTPGSKGEAADDWIIVNKENNSAAAEAGPPDLESFVRDAAIQPTMEMSNEGPNTRGDDLQDFEGSGDEDPARNFEANDFGEGIDFGDLDTAGEALSGYAQEIENSGFAENEDIDLNDSTFGEQFQQTRADAAQNDQAPGP